MKLLLITGGRSTEHLISRMSCLNVYYSLDKQKYDISILGITQNGEYYDIKSYDNIANDKWLNKAKRIMNLFKYLKEYDVVFPVLHGKYGEDGSIQGLLDFLNIPYVGCGITASAIAMDKVYTKIVLESVKIKQVPYLYVKCDNNSLKIIDGKNEYDKDIVNIIINKIGLPCFVKASRSGSSIGCFKVEKKSDIITKIKEASLYDDKVLIEKFINAREIECAILGNNTLIASVLGEILPHGDFYSYDSKYNDKESLTIIPAEISRDKVNRIQEIAIKAYKAIGAKGMARCDFFIDKDTKTIYLNEINTIPGFTDISMYPKLMEANGFNTTLLLDKLIELALNKE